MATAPSRPIAGASWSEKQAQLRHEIQPDLRRLIGTAFGHSVVSQILPRVEASLLAMDKSELHLLKGHLSGATRGFADRAECPTMVHSRSRAARRVADSAIETMTGNNVQVIGEDKVLDLLTQSKPVVIFSNCRGEMEKGLISYALRQSNLMAIEEKVSFMSTFDRSTNEFEGKIVNSAVSRFTIKNSLKTAGDKSDELAELAASGTIPVIFPEFNDTMHGSTNSLREVLELLKSDSFARIGIDPNEVMVVFCTSSGADGAFDSNVADGFWATEDLPYTFSFGEPVSLWDLENSN